MFISSSRNASSLDRNIYLSVCASNIYLVANSVFVVLVYWCIGVLDVDDGWRSAWRVIDNAVCPIAFLTC
jgi:hypothetical protein